MSDIPRARSRLQDALNSKTLSDCKLHVYAALTLMTREKPKFRAPRAIPPLTPYQRAMAQMLRRRRIPINEIARKLGTNIGRVSEAINGKRNGI